MKLRLIAIIACPVAIFALTGLFLAGLSYGNKGEVVKIKSGLITTDPLNNGALTFTSSALGEKKPVIMGKEEGRPQWNYFGSAVPRKSPVIVYEDSVEGLHLGIKATTANNWTGFFAMSNDDYSKVYHAVINVSYSSISQGGFSAGMYIQTSVIHPHINYVACVGEVDDDGVVWTIESGTGTADQVTDRHILWSDDNPSLPLKRDCTIVTDGISNFKVYFDHKLVYSANNLTLQMPMPFNSYLEVQTTNSKQFLYGVFGHYYSTLDEYIKIINVPKDGSVVIVSNDTKSATKIAVDSDGVAYLNVGALDPPFSGEIKVYDSKGGLIASTSQSIRLSGGDIYSAISVSPLHKWLLNS